MVGSEKITKEGEKMQAVTVIQPTLTEEKSRIQRVAAYYRVSTDSADQLHLQHKCGIICRNFLLLLLKY